MVICLDIAAFNEFPIAVTASPYLFFKNTFMATVLISFSPNYMKLNLLPFFCWLARCNRHFYSNNFLFSHYLPVELPSDFLLQEFSHISIQSPSSVFLNPVFCPSFIPPRSQSFLSLSFSLSLSVSLPVIRLILVELSLCLRTETIKHQGLPNYLQKIWFEFVVISSYSFLFISFSDS